MTMLGRRRHSRFLLGQPIEGRVRVREEVTVEDLGDREVVVLSPEACRPDEQVTLEIPGNGRRHVNARVAESRPAVTDDGVIRHRVRLIVEQHVARAAHSNGGSGE